MIQQNSLNGSPGTRPGEGLNTDNSLGGPPLSEAQIRAADMIMAGQRLGAIAQGVGVDCGTIYRWRTENFRFIDLLQRWQTEVEHAAGDRLLAMVESARDAIALEMSQRFIHKVERGHPE